MPQKRLSDPSRTPPGTHEFCWGGFFLALDAGRRHEIGDFRPRSPGGLESVTALVLYQIHLGGDSGLEADRFKYVI
jgi:hypothetical protein